MKTILKHDRHNDRVSLNFDNDFVFGKPGTDKSRTMDCKLPTVDDMVTALRDKSEDVLANALENASEKYHNR